jgi:hypothetical protein
MISNFNDFVNENLNNSSEDVSVTDLLKSKSYKNVKALGGEILWDSTHQNMWIDKGVLTVQFETHKILPSEARYSKLKKEFPEFDFKSEDNKIYKYTIETETNKIWEISSNGSRLEYMNRNVTNGKLKDPSNNRPYTSLDTQFIIEKALVVICEGMKDVIDNMYSKLYKAKSAPIKKRSL